MENIFDNKPERLCLHCKKCGNDEGFIKDFYEKPPEGCGYEGWFFLEWEKYKQNIRKLKERLLVLEVQLKNCKDSKKATKIASDIQKTKDKIKGFNSIGPTDL
ncbi:hypothetical protein IJ818_00690 [bacterium]|nr:hypothetical protein [bacterium]